MVIDLLNRPIDPEMVQLIDKEGDFEEWRDEYSGYLCRIRRPQPYSQWNGYVRLPDNSTLGTGIHELSYDDVEVHGGLTYMDKFMVPGLDDNGIWVGFDCAHGGDYVPSMSNLGGLLTRGQYRDKEYVKKECTSLAKQLKDLEGC